MRRLTALIKAIVPFPAEIRDEFFKTVKVLDLMPGEWIPDDLPSGTSIFVEEGLLLLTRYEDNRWKCVNFYFEGMLAATYSKGAPEMQEGSYRVRASEPTRVYYLTREDKHRVEEFFPVYAVASSVLVQRSYMKNRLRGTLFAHPVADRVILVDLHFRPLLRAPLRDLTDFLGVEDEVGKTILEVLQEKWLSSEKQLAQKHN